jgi:transcriptional regulator with XRE-family HTH domain
MDRTGEKLRRVRERLKLTYRDVSEASREIAARRGSPEFLVPLSRLADIENNGRVPSIFRLYSLCAIYRLNLHEVLRWYGVPVEHLAADGLQVGLVETHAVQPPSNGHAAIPADLEPELNPRETTFLSGLLRQWGKLPWTYLNGVAPDHRDHRYGFVGIDDWSMFPILRPGSLVLIDQGRRKILRGGWTSEFDRPIYFLEHRGGFLCGWCTLEGEQLLVQPHPASEKRPSAFRYPDEIDVIGQVVGAAMLLEPKKRRHTRPSTVPVGSPDRLNKADAPHREQPAE